MRSTPVKSIRIDKKIFLLLTAPEGNKIIIDAMMIAHVERIKVSEYNRTHFWFVKPLQVTFQLFYPYHITKILLPRGGPGPENIFVTETPEEILKLIKES